MNMNKKESALASMPRLVMSVTLIVMLGAFFGVLYYFATNVGDFNLPITVTPNKKEVVVKMDKTEYEQGEAVKITIKNNLDKKMHIGSPPYVIEKLDSGAWIEIKTVFCPCEVLCKLGKSIVQPNGITEYQWNQKESWCSDPKESTTISNQVDPGIYRIKTQISNEDGSNRKTIYSNEFTIKEKSAIDPRCGQKVEFIPCRGSGEGYEFDDMINECTKKLLQESCIKNTPFNSLEECQKTCEKQQTDFYSCSQDSDCISVKAGCCGCNAGGSATSINKNYKNFRRGNCGEELPVMCPAVMSDDPSCFAEPRCVENKCVLKQDEDICDIGKGDGDFGGIEGIFTEDSLNYYEIKSSCEQKNECKWEGLGGKMKMNYACCPKDFESSKNIQVQQRCLIRID